MKLPRHAGLILIGITVVALIVIGFIPRPVLVDAETVRVAPLQVTIEEEGKTRVIDRYVVSAPVDGYARRIDMEVGDLLEKSQRITCLEPLRSSVLDPRAKAEAKARLAAANAALEAAQRNVHAAEADAEYAANELQRRRRLYEAKMISLEEFQEAETEARRTRAQLESAMFARQVARYEKEAAEAVLKYSAAAEMGNPAEIVSITSPVQGRILKIHHESEGVVKQGDPIVEVGDIRSLQVEVDVLSRDAVKISSGTRVVFERWGGDQSLLGIVERIEPVGFTKISALGVEEQRVWVIINIISPPEDWSRLGDGYRMEAKFILWHGEDILQIPSSALFSRNGEWHVFVIRDNRARLQKVGIGRQGGLFTEIASGLEEGMRVINHPSDQVEDGVRIRF